MLAIRQAVSSDALEASKLLADTTGEFGVAVLGLGNPALQLKAFQRWFSTGGNRFSYQHSIIAESDHTPAGLALSFAGSQLTALELGCAKEIFKIYGLGGAIRMIWRNKTLAGAREAERDEYLLAHLAVHPRFRNQGIAQALLEVFFQKARDAGFHRLVLEVEIENQAAIKLYQKNGFEIKETVFFNQTTQKFNSPGYHKMFVKI
jgi:ribosomal protein S18 acetylase RimI-like enzyme